MNLAGTLEIGWYPTISWETAEKWDAKTELPKHPSYLNPPMYHVRASDGQLIEAWVRGNVEWEFGSESKNGVEFAVRTYYDCMNLSEMVLFNAPATILSYTVKRYLLYEDADSFHGSPYGSVPNFRGLDNVLFRRRDELTWADIYKDPDDLSKWTYVFRDRLRLWHNRFQYRQDLLKLLGGPADWNVTMTVGAVGETTPEEEMAEVFKLVQKYPARPYNWRKTY